MRISRAYKVELDPNDVQKTALLRHAGAARWAYNWGLRRKIDTYKATGKSPSAIDLHKELNVLKRTDKAFGGVPWMYEVSKCAAQEALRDLDRAYSNFFRRCKEKKAGPKGFPKFKSKHRGIGNFHLTGALRASEDHVQLPRIGSVRLKESGYLPTPDQTEIRILSATVCLQAGHVRGSRCSGLEACQRCALLPLWGATGEESPCTFGMNPYRRWQWGLDRAENARAIADFCRTALDALPPEANPSRSE